MCSGVHGAVFRCSRGCVTAAFTGLMARVHDDPTRRKSAAVAVAAHTDNYHRLGQPNIAQAWLASAEEAKRGKAGRVREDGKDEETERRMGEMRRNGKGEKKMEW